MTPAQDPAVPAAELESADLLDVAAKAGARISDRLLEAFRAQGLIPRPRRAGHRGRAPVWLYPPGTDRQLLALLTWRERTKEPDMLRVLLWLDGFSVTTAAARDALARQIRGVMDDVSQAINRCTRNLGLDPSEATAQSRGVDELARVMADKRGDTPLVRRSRMRASDRAEAVSMMVRIFGIGEIIDGTAHDASLVETVMGLAPNGRRHSINGEEPWLTGLAEDLFGAAEIVSLPRLAEAVSSATDAELDTARQTVIALSRYLPLMIRMIGVMFDDDNYTGLAGLGQLDQQPASVMLLVPMVIAMVRAGRQENLDTIVTALQPFPELAARAQQILEMPTAQVEANLTGQQPAVRQQVERLIEAAVDGQLEIRANRSGDT
jgi:hypothetical protein